jgi:hypothetical protein
MDSGKPLEKYHLENQSCLKSRGHFAMKEKKGKEDI